MIEFTELELEDLIRTTLAPQYFRSPRIQSLFEFDDVVQDCIMWYYQPMKNGEQRLEHYKRECKSLAHLVNTIKLSLCQYIPGLLRLNYIKYAPTSLNVPLKDDSETEFIDLVESNDDPLETTFQLSQMIEELNDKQREVLNDIIAGETKTNMRLKYKDFDCILERIRDNIYLYYISSGDNLESEFNIGYQLSLTGFKEYIKPLVLKQRAMKKFFETGNIMYYLQSKKIEEMI